MSHFAVVVFVPENELVEETVSRLMEPYNSDISVPEYERECSCIHTMAHISALERVYQELGHIDRLRDQYWSEIHSLAEKTMAEKKQHQNVGKSEEICLEMWKKKLSKTLKPSWEERIRPYIELQEKYEKEYLASQNPDPDCEYCNGTGKEKSTCNPFGKWDWFVIEKVLSEKQKHELPKEFVPFALVTPDGEWHERTDYENSETNGREKTGKWKNFFRNMVKKYGSSHYLVLVDCHC